MIVNPQEFNYRIIIGMLVATIAFLAAYGYNNFNNLSSENEFLIHEKKLLQSERNEIINKYDELNVETMSLQTSLDQEKANNQIAHDSIEFLKADVALMNQFKARLKTLEAENKKLNSQPLQEEINDLKKKNESLISANNQQQTTIQALENKADELEETLSKARLIYANSFDANALTEKKSGDFTQTKRAKNTDVVEVCFVIGENHMAPKGEREIYVQILDPDNNVVADKGSVNFGESSLIYSSKMTIDFDNDAQEICVSVPNENRFKEGAYYVSIFEKQRKLGQTQLDLY